MVRNLLKTALACLLVASAAAANHPLAASRVSQTRNPAKTISKNHKNVALTVRGGAARSKKAVGTGGSGATIAASVFNLANNVAGAGILTLAAGKASGTGWVPSIAILLAIAYASSHTFYLVGKSMELTGCGTFKDLWCYAFDSDTSAYIVDLAVFLQCFFVSVLYTGLLGDVFSTLIRENLGWHGLHTSRNGIILLAVTLVLGPLNHIRDLKRLAFTSTLGLCSVLYTVLFIVIRALDGTYHHGGVSGSDLADLITGGDLAGLVAGGGSRVHIDISSTTISSTTISSSTTSIGRFLAGGMVPHMPSFHGSTWWNVDLKSLVLISNLGLAFISHYNAPSYWKSLGDRASAATFKTIARRAYLILAAIYLSTMVGGYATFGDSCQGNILINYSSTDFLATLGRLATGFSILFGFPLISNGCREGFKNVCVALNIFGGTAVSDPKNHSRVVIGLLTCTTIVSILVRDIAIIAGITGALMGSCLVYIFPALMYAKIVERKCGLASSEYQLARRNLAWVPFGVFTAVMGVAMTIQKAVTR